MVGREAENQGGPGKIAIGTQRADALVGAQHHAPAHLGHRRANLDPDGADPGCTAGAPNSASPFSLSPLTGDSCGQLAAEPRDASLSISTGKVAGGQICGENFEILSARSP
jgi:hypothetical protein